MEKFSVGDTVTIVPQPNEACPFSWAPSMDQYCGMTARIMYVRYSHDRHCSPVSYTHLTLPTNSRV